MDATDEALMRAYVGGDRGAFTRLFDRLAPAIHAFFLRSMRSRTTAEDLVQTTFLHVHRSRERWEPDRPLRPWVFGIAAHVRQDALRRDRGLSREAGEEEIAAAEAALGGDARPDPEVALFRRSRAERVDRALEALPESQRTVIHLNRFEALTFPEIAAALGTTEGAVRVRAFRGYERLRIALADLLEEDA
jgi:RNA polymerase sigma factor (sigma-70 family)